MPFNSTSWGSTKTFRRTSRMILGIFGSNLQNSTKKQLTMYEPSKLENIFLQIDQSGAEALIVAYLCKNGRFRSLFLNNIKSHVYVAMHIFSNYWLSKGYGQINYFTNAPIELLAKDSDFLRLSKVIKEDDQKYFIGKKCCHSFNYSMKPNTFRDDVLKESEGSLVLTKIESEIFHDTYHRIFPEISLWWEDIKYQVHKTGYLYNLHGFPFHAQGPFTDKDWRELIAWTAQSTVGTITANAIVNLQSWIESQKLAKEWHIRNDKHDSLLLELPERHKEIAAAKLKELIEVELISPRGEEFRMKSEISWGRNWGKYNPEKNPQGMREL